MQSVAKGSDKNSMNNSFDLSAAEIMSSKNLMIAEQACVEPVSGFSYNNSATFLDTLKRRAQEQPNELAYVFMDDDGEEEELSYRELEILVTKSPG